MADVKWIKIVTDIFDNKKIKIMESMPDGDSLIVIWFKILILAGDVNDNGLVYFTKDIPYTDQMLATYFNRPLPSVQLALNTFEKFGMIEIIDDVIHVSNWEKYQNVEGMDKIREQTRLRVAKHREKKKRELLEKKEDAIIGNEKCNVTVTHSNETEGEGDIDIDINNISSTKVDDCPSSEEEPTQKYVYQEIVDMWNTLSEYGIPKIKSIPESSPRVPMLRKRLKEYGKDSFKKIIDEVKNSDFLQGKVQSGNRNPFNLDFDWVIKPSNYPKILEQKYRNKNSKTSTAEPKGKYSDYE